MDVLEMRALETQLRKDAMLLNETPELRDLFAMSVFNAVESGQNWCVSLSKLFNNEPDSEEAARACYRMADAFMKVRNER